eukprot:7124195-Karenia_brevis.AAC.1
MAPPWGSRAPERAAEDLLAAKSCRQKRNICSRPVWVTSWFNDGGRKQRALTKEQMREEAFDLFDTDGLISIVAFETVEGCPACSRCRYQERGDSADACRYL